MHRHYKNIIYFALTCLNFVKCDDQEAQSNLAVYHLLEPGEALQYELRGYINIHSKRNEPATYIQDYVLSTDDVRRLKKLAVSNDFYRVKLSLNSGSDEKSLYSFTKACSIYESCLNDEITIALDQGGNPVGIAISATPSHCFGVPVSDSSLRMFNTTVNVVNLTNAPIPDTLTYIQRLEQEKAEKARGEQGDNRSFLSKYWMYIVPLVIFLFISGASNPEGQATGH